MIENARDTLDDGKPEPEPERRARALIETLKFLEDDFLLSSGNAEARVDDVDAQFSAPAPAADQHLPARRIFDRVRNQILQQPAQQPAVRSNGERAGKESKLQPFLGGERRKLNLELA